MEPASTVVRWGSVLYNATETGISNVITIDSGYEHSVVVKNDGTVVCFGRCYGPMSYLPPITNNFAAASSSIGHTLGLRTDGTVVAWGYNELGSAVVPAGLTGVVAIETGNRQSMALKNDGTVVSWGQFGDNVPAGLTGVTAISANLIENYFHALALKADGTVAAWGANDYGESTVPAGLSNIVAVASGGYHSLALRSDGTVVAWGGQDSAIVTPPAGLSNVVAIAAGNWHNLALKSDGTVVGWKGSTVPNWVFGGGVGDASVVPVGLSNVVAISAGVRHSVALTRDLPPLMLEPLYDRSITEGQSTYFAAWAGGTEPFSYQWQRNGENLPGQNGPVLWVYNASSADAGVYTVVVSNRVGSVTSPGAMLNVGPWIAFFFGPQSQTVDAGVNVTLSANAVGTEPISYQWRKNRVNIPGATSTSLTLSSVQPADSGRYSLVASNAAGIAVSSDAYLLVRSLVGPNITVHPEPATVFVGAKLEFSVVATGTAPLSYQWIKDGANVSGATSPVLSFNTVQSSDAGTYSVTVTDSSGTVTSASAALTLVPAPTRTFSPPGTVVSIGGPFLPMGLTNVIGIAAGLRHGLALRSDGTVVGWGGQLFSPEPPPGLSNVVAISGDDVWSHSLALKADGTVVAWGFAPDVPAGLFGVTAIDAGDQFGIALKADGTVVTWPDATVPPGLEDAIAVAAGRDGTAFALRSDGTVKAWGQAADALRSLSGVEAISASTDHTIVLKKNGTVLDYSAVGSDPSNVAPTNLSGVIAISAGSHALALKNDGTVVGWRGADLPPGLSHVSAIAAGGGFSLLITTNPPQPMLAAARAADRIALATPIAVAGYLLEGASGLGMPYSPIEISPNMVSLSESNNGALLLPISGGQKFFRLRKVE